MIVRIGVVLAVLGALACVKETCLVIDAAHAACAVITYTDGNGVAHRVRMTQDDLVESARMAEARASRDAGVD